MLLGISNEVPLFRTDCHETIAQLPLVKTNVLVYMLALWLCSMLLLRTTSLEHFIKASTETHCLDSTFSRDSYSGVYMELPQGELHAAYAVDK